MDLVRVLSSGSKGNCTIIKYKQKTYIIDIGISYKMFKEKCGDLFDFDECSLFISHTHSDHIKGLKVFCKNHQARIFGSSMLLEHCDSTNVITKKTMVDDIYVEPLFLSHDCKETLGYIFYLGDYKIVIVSDTGYLSSKNIGLMSNPDILLLESNHDVDMLMSGSYSWPLKKRVVGDTGHLSNAQFMSYANNIIGESTKYVVALHLSEENNCPTIVEEVMQNIKVDNCYVASQSMGCNIIKLNWR